MGYHDAPKGKVLTNNVKGYRARTEHDKKKHTQQ